jgi:low temperature requirement protein LtrA
MVFGIVLVALGLKKTLLDIAQPLYAVTSVALFGGAALYLIAHVLFRLRNMGTLNVQRLVCAAVLLALIPVGLVVPSLVSLGLVTVLLVGLVAFEAIRYRDTRHQLRQHSGH